MAESTGDTQEASEQGRTRRFPPEHLLAYVAEHDDPSRLEDWDDFLDEAMDAVICPWDEWTVENFADPDQSEKFERLMLAAAEVAHILAGAFHQVRLFGDAADVDLSPSSPADAALHAGALLSDEAEYPPGTCGLAMRCILSTYLCNMRGGVIDATLMFRGVT